MLRGIRPRKTGLGDSADDVAPISFPKDDVVECAEKESVKFSICTRTFISWRLFED